MCEMKTHSHIRSQQLASASRFTFMHLCNKYSKFDVNNSRNKHQKCTEVCCRSIYNECILCILAKSTNGFHIRIIASINLTSARIKEVVMFMHINLL